MHHWPLTCRVTPHAFLSVPYLQSDTDWAPHSLDTDFSSAVVISMRGVKHAEGVPLCRHAKHVQTYQPWMHFVAVRMLAAPSCTSAARLYVQHTAKSVLRAELTQKGAHMELGGMHTMPRHAYDDYCQYYQG